MLVLGAASNPWEMLSSLQPLQPANGNAPAAGLGVGAFVADETASLRANAAGLQSIPPPTGTTGQASLSPDVLGFLIWNQSQQPGTQPASGGTDASATGGTNNLPGAAGGIADAAGITGSVASSLQSLLSLFGSAGDGMFGSSATGVGAAVNGNTPAGTPPPNQNVTSVDLGTSAPGKSSATAAAQPPTNANNFLEALTQLQALLLAPSAAA